MSSARAVAGQGAPCSEFRILRDGQVRWLHSEGRIICDCSNRPVRVTGITWDITTRKEADAARRKSEERLSAALRAGKLGVYDYNPRTGRLNWDPTHYRLFGVPEDEPVTYETFEAGVHPEDLAAVRDVIAQAVAVGSDHHYECEYRAVRRVDGTVRWIFADGTVMFDAEGPCRLLGYVQDITQRKQAEEALRESEARLQAVLNGSLDPIFMKDREGRMLLANPATCAAIGKPAEAVLGKTDEQFLDDPADARAIMANDRRIMLSGEPETVEEMVSTASRTRYYVNKKVARRDPAGNVIGLISTARDVTEQKRAEEALRESEARLRSIIEHMPIPMVLTDEDGKTVLINPAFTKLTGYTLEDIPTPDAWAQLAYRDAASSKESLRAALHSQTATDGGDHWIHTKSGGRRLWTVLAAPAGHDAGGKRFTVGVALDLTERHRAEEALRESEERLRLALDAGCMATWDWDIPTGAVRWNEEHYHMLGYKLAEVEPGYETWASRVLPDDFAATEALLLRTMDQGGDYQAEFRVLGPKDQIRWLEARGRFERDNEGRAIRSYGVMMDITERKEAEEALRRSEERERHRRKELETLLAAIPAAVLIAEDRACEQITANQAGYKLMRIPEGRNVSKSALEEERPAYETYSAAGELLAAGQLPMQRAAATGKSIEGFEHELRFADGGHKHVLGNALPLFDAAGEVRGAVAALLDITERKHQEERIKLLLGEVNHRAKNMLAVVQSVARQTAAASPQDFLERFSERVQALAASQDLLVKAEWRGVQLPELIRKQLAHFKDLIGSRIELRGPSLLLSASAAQTLGMAIHELATNAGKYGALSVAEGRVAIGWGVEGDGAGGETFTISWREQGGPPVAPPSREGFGSTVIGALAESSLDAKVELDFLKTGLSWRLHCPAAGVIEGTRSVPAAKARSELSAPRCSRPKVLVVEDEALVAMEIAQVLRDADFEVLGPARSVAAALSLIEKSGCDAAVLDINLTRETSEPVARKLLASGTRFVTLSGYSRTQHPPIFDGVPALVKPLRPDLLVAEIRKCLLDQEKRPDEFSG